MKLSHLGKLTLPLALAATLVAGVPLEALACTQMWMPDSLTQEENTWYFGRAEDTAPRGVKIFGVEPAHAAGFVYQSNENGDFAEGPNFQWTSPTKTFRYTYVRDHGVNDWEGAQNAYSAAGINENGVSCSATLSIYSSPETKAADPNPADGIGEFNYASIILGQSKTARDGIELIGSLIDEYGACSCDQLIISDSKESWLLSVVSGHQWIAFQLPEDQASANPNMGSLWYKVDLDGANVLHSANLVSLPTEKGFLKTFEDGTPDIGRTYSRLDEGVGQFSRYVVARAYYDSLEGLQYTVGDYTDRNGKVHPNYITGVENAPLFFTPGRTDYTTFDMVRSLGARVDNVKGLEAVNPAVTGVGRQDSLESHMFEIKRNTDPQIATVEWLALNRDEFSVAIPSYGALVTEVNPRYGSQDMDTYHQGDDYGDDSVALARHAGEWDQYLPYVLMDINTLANADRTNVAPGTRAYLDALQKELIAQHDKVEAQMLKTPKAQRTALANKAAYVAAEKTWERCYTLLQDMRAYYKGSQDKPFVASDFNMSTKGLSKPFMYATDTLASSVSLAKAKVTTAKSSYTYTGKALKPAVTVKLDGKTLKAGTDYTVSYKSNTKVGKATITVTGKGMYKSSVTKTFKIVPKKTGVAKLTAAKKGATVTWKAQKAQADGYQVKFATNKNMTSAKTKLVKGAKTTSVKLTGLKSGKTYYVQLRTYKNVKVDGKTVKYYSAWSAAKSVRVK